MNEHPILFSTPMVKAILEGRKTQTRRIIKPQPTTAHFDTSANPPTWYDGIKELQCQYGSEGDHLWVRETWRYTSDRVGEPVAPEFEYRANYSGVRNTGKWRPSIFMPRAAIRLTLEVVAIRVERLNNISEEDIRAEGTPTPNPPPNNWMDDSKWRATFAYLWDSINEKRGFGWDTNPWVWVVEFKRLP